jgi:hypothetical protein
MAQIQADNALDIEEDDTSAEFVDSNSPVDLIAKHHDVAKISRNLEPGMNPKPC